LINQPVSFFQQHRILLIPGLIVAVLLITIIFILAFSVSRIRKTRNELARSEEKYRGLFATILDGLILVDPESRAFIEVNPAICRMTGYTTEEMSSLRVEDMHPEESFPHVLAQFEKQMSGAITLAPDLPVKRKDGEVFYADVHAIPLQIYGRPMFLGVFRDVTERKMAEDLLRESEQRHREYILNAPYGVFVTDEHGYYQQVNPAACHLTGYSESELLAMSIADILAEEALENGLRLFQKVVQAGKSQGAHCCRTKSGERRWWMITACKVSDARILGFCEDITERKQFEAALLESEARIRAITESANDAIVMTDQRGLVSYWNPAAERIFGYKAEEVLGIDLHHLITPKRYHDAINADFPKFQQTGEGAALNVPLEMEARHKNGHEISVELSLSALHHHDGWHTVGIARNITERKQAEEERKQLQAQLVQAQKMEAIGTLAGGIAHDFNNILGAILGYTEIAIDSIAPDSIAINYLDKVMEASRRAAGLVKQILAFSRQTDTERVVLQPALIVKEVIKLLRPSLPSTITIRRQIDTAVKPILADPTQLHQILMNLCTNAYHAMEQTGGILEITLKDCERSLQELPHQLQVHPGEFVQLSVGDSGPGIAPEIRDKIFEPYFTTKEVGKGTGMGLAIVHGIVTGYGGFVTCESERGRGTVFHQTS
ncbi:MAG: PAS domain S-box protein, partial [Desulfobulbaceae bacterium]|nr:PAS domain S-box protein [Desulfobulbaceae bacterium]